MMSVRILCRLLTFLTALAPIIRLSAQSSGLPSPSEAYVQKTWTVEDGLPESSPTAIAQTPDGYLWIGTWNGLARFDGSRFVTFHSGISPAFTVSRISSLLATPEGALWIGTGGGGLVHYVDGTFRSYAAESGLSNLFVNAVAKDTRGNIWIGTDKGLFVGRDGQFSALTGVDAGLTGRVYRIDADTLGAVYVQTPGKSYRVERQDGDGRILREYPGGETFLDDLGRVWYWDRHSILHREDERGKVSFRSFQHLRHTSSWPLKNGGIGICFLDRIILLRDGQITELPSIGETKLSANEVLYEDREGNVWLGRASSGLARIRRSPLTVLSYASGLSSEVVASITEDAAGTLWVGTYRQGLDRRVGDRFRRQRDGAVEPTATVNLLWRDPGGAVWAGPNLGGLVRIRDDKRYARGIVTPTTSVRAIAADSQGAWWIGTGGGGVQRDLAGRLSEWNEARGLTSNDITAITCASDGSIWVGTSARGANRIEGDRTTPITSNDGLSSNEIQAILEDARRSIWIATRRGLNRWKNGVLTRLSEQDGLPDEAISSIVEDGLGFIWFGGTKGIFRASVSDLNAYADGTLRPLLCRAFGTEDGLVTSEVGGAGTPRAWKDRAGTLWFASERGLIRIDPRSIEVNEVPPPVVIEEVLVDHEPWSLKTPLRIGPTQSRVEFQFTGISFRSTNRVRFRYRLEGMERDWQDGGGRRFVQYTHLPTGEYTFRVSAANSDGVWNETGASLAVVVLPPFYATWWFMTLMFLCFAAGGPTVYYLRVRGLKQEQERQREFSRKLIERQEEERRRISRDLHDSLGQELLVLKHQIQSRLRGRRLTKGTISLLGGLSETVSGAIALVRHISHNLRPPELDRLGLTETLKAILERVRSASVFELTGEIDDVDGCFSTEQEISVVRMVQEAINNAIKHSQATSVHVSVQRLGHQVAIEVTDNGAGFSDADGGKGGIGLADMRERARLMFGTFEIDQPPSGGTRVRMSLPMKGSEQ